MHKFVLAVGAALVIVLPWLACSRSAGGKIRTLTLQARGVAFSVEVNGKASELLSSSGTGAVASGIPLDKADFKTHSGDNELVLRVLRVEPSADPAVLVDLQESAPGDIVSTEGGGARKPPFPVELGADQLQVGSRLAYHFVLP